MRRDVRHLHPVDIVVPLDHMVETVFPVHRHQRVAVLIHKKESAVSIGGYHVADVYTDENGEQRFMGVGKTGPSGGEESIKSENSPDEIDDVQENENLPDEINDIQENNYNPEGIVGTELKRGWTSSDNSILKGKDVSVKEDSTLFSINLEQEKEVVIHYDIVLDEGEYQLVYISPDGTEQILHDGKIIQSEEKILFTQGQNEISILSNNAVFKEIDISIIGIQVSDF